MIPLVLIGGGGHCKSCLDVIEAHGKFHPVGIIDKEISNRNSLAGIPFIGTDKDISFLFPKYNNAFITVGQISNSKTRKKLFKKMKSLGMNFPTILSPSALVSNSAKINDGTIIMHRSVLNAGVIIGCNTIINTMALLEHDVEIGSHCHISTGAMVNGGVTIFDGSFVGSGAIIYQGVKIGREAIIAAGAVVRKDVADGELVRGNK